MDRPNKHSFLEGKTIRHLLAVARGERQAIAAGRHRCLLHAYARAYYHLADDDTVTAISLKQLAAGARVALRNNEWAWVLFDPVRADRELRRQVALRKVMGWSRERIEPELCSYLVDNPSEARRARRRPPKLTDALAAVREYELALAVHYLHGHGLPPKDAVEAVSHDYLATDRDAKRDGEIVRAAKLPRHQVDELAQTLIDCAQDVARELAGHTVPHMSRAINRVI